MLIVGAAEAAKRERAEFLAWALADFTRFCGIVDIVPKSGKRQKLVLNEIQRAYCAGRTPRDNVLKPRQVGFTTEEQARDVYYFLTVPGARVVATCQSLTDHAPSRLLAKNYRVMFESLERAGLRLNFRTQSTGEWVLADRDASLRIEEAGASEAAASKKGRAGVISRLHLTETAFYEYADETRAERRARLRGRERVDPERRRRVLLPAVQSFGDWRELVPLALLPVVCGVRVFGAARAGRTHRARE